MDKLRLRFSKTGRAIYISHLDLMRTMQRSFARAKLPLRYSEGFNPHAQISIALPLSVGASSVCELMDFRLLEYPEPAAIPELLNPFFPEGIRAAETYEPSSKFKEIKWLEVSGELEYDSIDPEAALPGLREFFTRQPLIITRKTKKGTGELDIAPAVRSIEVSASEQMVSVRAVVSAQEPSLNPELLIQALSQLAPELAPDFARFERREVFDGEMRTFR